MKRFLVAGVLGALALIACAPAASASSPAAWDAFRSDLRARCLAAARSHMAKIQVQVDPYGSESYGFALVRGVAGKTPVTRLCVVPKTGRGDGQAEISDETRSFSK